MSKIKGGDMMLFLSTKSIAYATSHTLEITGETSDTSNKDEGGGDWSAQEVNLLSWSASTENLYSLDGKGSNFDDLFDMMVNRKEIPVAFSLESGYATKADEVPEAGWTPSTSQYTGKVVITSLELNAPNGDNATFSASFEGVGPLTKTA